MDKNLLRIDLDLSFKFKCVNLLKERLSYVHDLGLLNCKMIDKIVLKYKTSYACQIWLKKDLFDEKNIVIMQLILGSDYMKEVNTIINHFKLGMEYSNRLFDVKRYRGGKIRVAREHNITKEVLSHVLSKKRRRFKN